MRFIYKILDLTNDKLLIILLEINLMLYSIFLNRKFSVVLWLVYIILDIIDFRNKDKKEE